MKTLIVVILILCCSLLQAQSTSTVTITVTTSGVTTTYQSNIPPSGIIALNQLITAIAAKQPPSFLFPTTSTPVDIGDLISQQISSLVLKSAMTYQSKLTDAGVIAANQAIAAAAANAMTTTTAATAALNQAIVSAASTTVVKTTN